MPDPAHSLPSDDGVIRYQTAMPSAERFAALQTIQRRKPAAVTMPASLQEIWASDVFNLDRMKEALPRNVFKSVQKTIREGGVLDLSVADAVASAMKDWAISRGALYYSHVFYPLTNLLSLIHI